MNTAEFRRIPHAERIAQVSAIQQTIPRDRVRVQMNKGEQTEMWGFVWLNRLPFCFRAWHSFENTRLDFLANGSLGGQTNWGYVLKPVRPDDFTAAVATVGITDDDRLYMLNGLRTKPEVVQQAVQTGRVTELLSITLRRREHSYQKYEDFYERDAATRTAFSTAVSIVCDEKEAEVLTLLHANKPGVQRLLMQTEERLLAQIKAKEEAKKKDPKKIFLLSPEAIKQATGSITSFFVANYHLPYLQRVIITRHLEKPRFDLLEVTSRKSLTEDSRLWVGGESPVFVRSIVADTAESLSSEQLVKDLMPKDTVYIGELVTTGNR